MTTSPRAKIGAFPAASRQMPTSLARTAGISPRPGLVCIPSTTEQFAFWARACCPSSQSASCLRARRQQLLTGRRQAHLLGQPFEQRDTHLLLQRADLLGKRGLADDSGVVDTVAPASGTQRTWVDEHRRSFARTPGASGRDSAQVRARAASSRTKPAISLGFSSAMK